MGGDAGAGGAEGAGAGSAGAGAYAGTAKGNHEFKAANPWLRKLVMA